MAKLETSGFDELQKVFGRLGDIPFEVTSKALTEMADVAAAKIKQSGEAMGVRDPASNVHILDKIVKRKAKKTQSGGYVDISFSGSRRRGKTSTRNAEIAFVNEYGKRGQPARPFIGKAMTAGEDAIAKPGEKILGDWIEKEFQK